MNAKVKKIQFPSKQRIIAISDIHGNLAGFKKLLKRCNYTEQDILVIVGDFIEKGSANLDTLRYLMKMSQNENVHVLTGNCDDLYQLVRTNDYDKFFLSYVLGRKSLIKDMCKELGITLDEQSDIKEIKQQLKDVYKEEFDWLEGLPTILETQKFIFVHAGITTENLQEQTYESAVSENAFLNIEQSFEKYVVVGHWPTSNYGNHRKCCNPIIDRKKHIISIDGGNVLNKFGQLNAFIIPEVDSTEFQFELYDDLPFGIIMKAQSGKEESINISWGDNKIEILEEKEEFSYCCHCRTDYKLWIPNSYISTDESGTYCDAITDYVLEVEEGDIVSVIDTWKDCCLAKKDGVVGFIKSKVVSV